MEERHPKVLKVKPPMEPYALLEASSFGHLVEER
jgi:hypothetical protein